MTEKVKGKETKELPKGIKTLRKLRVSKINLIKPRTFDRIVGILRLCAGDQNPRTLKCYRCQYRVECKERFDYLCDKVAWYKTSRQGGLE